MSARDLVLTGIPRSGTTLCCHLLARCEASVALFEPMPVHALPLDPAAAIDAIVRFYADVRAGITATGAAPSKQVGGAVPDNPFSGTAADGHRMRVAEEGTIAVAVDPSLPYTLTVKHNAAFAALLPGLAAVLPTFAIVRNPMAVLGSWNSVELPVREGRVPAAERLDQALAARLRETPAGLARQVVVLDWFCDRFATLAPGHVLRYEDIVASSGKRLYDATGCRPATATPLTSRNRTRAPSDVSPRTLRAALEAGACAWRRWYEDAELDAQLTAMETAE